MRTGCLWRLLGLLLFLDELIIVKVLQRLHLRADDYFVSHFLVDGATRGCFLDEAGVPEDALMGVLALIILPTDCS